MTTEPNVEVNVEIPEPEPEPETSPDVVVVESGDSGSNDAVEAAVVETAVESAGDIARLEVIVQQQQDEIAKLNAQIIALTEGTALALEESAHAQEMAAEAAEPDAQPASEDEEPAREHWWYR